MRFTRRLALVSVMVFAPIAPAVAQDQIIDQSACDFFCAMWRNVSGKAQVSSPTPIDNAERETMPLPQAVEGAEAPQPGRIVRRRGVVIEETAAERAAVRRGKLALERETTQHIAEGERTMRKVLGRQDDAAR